MVILKFNLGRINLITCLSSEKFEKIGEGGRLFFFFFFWINFRLLFLYFLYIFRDFFVLFCCTFVKK